VIDRDRDLYSIDLAHIRDKQVFALRPFSYRTPAVDGLDMGNVGYMDHVLNDSEASLCSKDPYTTRARIGSATPRSTLSHHQRQRASALGLVLYCMPALLVQDGFATVESVRDTPYIIHVLFCGGRRAIRERSERERLSVTDVRQIDAVEVAIAIDHPITTRSS
jgi:hypothetical protein